MCAFLPQPKTARGLRLGEGLPPERGAHNSPPPQMGLVSSPSGVLKHVKLAYNLWRHFTSSRIKPKCLKLAPTSLFDLMALHCPHALGSSTPECESAHGHLHTFAFGVPLLCLNVFSSPDVPLL